MKTLFRSKEDIVLINQDAVSHYIVEGKSLHNAIWDSYYSKDKNLYLSLCSELTTSEYAQLAKFENDKLELLFETKSIIFPNNHQIRDSKIHTAIDEMEDGRLIMITHTTDKAPALEDNYSTTNLESISCGTPVITFDTGGSPESVTDKTGFICLEKNLESIRMGIDFIKKSTEDYKDNCVSYAKEHFDKNQALKYYLELFEEGVKI